MVLNTRSYFEVARIHIGQKIHDALLTASTQFMREWATMQRYIATIVQQRGSSVSTN
jgi:hypothetical protein